MKKVITLLLLSLTFTLFAGDLPAPPTAPGLSATPGLSYLLIPILTPLLIAFGKWLVPRCPAWLLPILAPGVGALVDYLSAKMGGPSVNPLIAAALGSAGVGLREIKDQIGKKISPAASPLLALAAAALVGFLATGCASNALAKSINALKNDPAAINAQIVTPWGTAHIARVGGTTNSVAVTPDGGILVNK
jgi:hypothetical protein